MSYDFLSTEKERKGRKRKKRRIVLLFFFPPPHPSFEKNPSVHIV